MLKMSTVAAFAFASLAVAAVPANATVLDFEDLAARPYFISMPTSYAGIDWAANFWAYSNTQNPYTAHSGITRIASNGNTAGDSSFSFTNDVKFDGAWFAGATSVSFQLYDNGNLVHTTSTIGTSSTPVFLSSGYGGSVDRVRVVGSNGNYVMDDVQFTAAVPEPETYALMLAGLGMMGAIARRRKAKQA